MGLEFSSSTASPEPAESKVPEGRSKRVAAQSHVTLLKDVDASVCDSHNTLFLGHLLEWMDAASCLAAEKHCGRSCVTLVMDDLDFTQDCQELLRVGERCLLEGKVTKAFGSSLEVAVNVFVAEVRSGSLKSVCNAYFMYVILKTDQEKAENTKVEAPELVPVSAEENLEFNLAERRRDFRKKRDKALGELSKESSPAVPVQCTPQSSKDIAVGFVSFTELVLPYHANHMGNTFGGQIMCWMMKAAKSAVWLHLRFSCGDEKHVTGVGGDPRIRLKDLKDAWLRPVTIDTIHFKAPSRVGDRVHVTAGVTRVFASSLEVFVRVTSAPVDKQDSPPEINVGYLDFAVHGPDRLLSPSIPDVVHGTVERAENHRGALARQRFRELRRQDQSQGQKEHGVGLCVDFRPDSHQAQELAVQCISCILSLNETTLLRWEKLEKVPPGFAAWVDMGLPKPGSVHRLKVQFEAKAPPRTCYSLLRDLSRRQEFDLSCRDCALVKECGSDADLVRMELQATSGERQEALLLRAYQESSNCFVVGSRSVRLDSFPITQGIGRAEIFPSGYIVDQAEEGDSNTSRVTFVGQFSHAFFDHVLQMAVLESARMFRDLVQAEAAGGGYATASA